MESVLTAMFQDLQTYKGRPNANADYIEKLERRISTLMAFYRAADGAILEAEEEKSQAFYKGLKKGREEAQQQPHRLDPANREAYRDYTISRARSSWPELF
jgi:hypothetical protein